MTDLLPPRDQKAYDLGARSAREVIDHLRVEFELLTQRFDRMVASKGTDWADGFQLAAEMVHEEHEADLETIRNQNSHMAWLEGQLQEGAARERAYVEAINDLCDEVVRIHAKARAILEGDPSERAEFESLKRDVGGYTAWSCERR